MNLIIEVLLLVFLINQLHLGTTLTVWVWIGYFVMKCLGWLLEIIFKVVMEWLKDAIK